jgi:hypothetical protein
MRFFLIFTLFASGCAVNTGVIEISGDSYLVSRQAATGFTGKGNLKEESLTEANIFCKRQQKTLKVLSIQEAQPPYILGNFPKAEIQFSCIENLTKNEINATKSEMSSSFGSIDKDKYQLDANKITSPKKNIDAVAIIIGIQNYKRLGKADYANQDAQIFYEYAHRALGIPKDRIKILTDSDADQAAFLKTFRNWLPLNVNKDKTDVFVFYSGHGLPSQDGNALYMLPYGVDQDLLDETAVDQRKINEAIQATKPKSVTMFIDSCYSGLSKNGENLLTSAKPVVLKNLNISYPPEFTIMTASSSTQISSSSPDLKHGIFSFYLMKGMEGNADIDKNGNITFGEMQKYLMDNVPRQAMTLNRKQEPQFIGDTNRVLIRR